MPNVVKYSTTAENNAIKKGNIAIGVNSVDYGGGGQSGWWNTIDVPTGGYVVYVNKASNGPSIMVPPNDTALVGVARSFGASTSVTTAAGALNYFASQSDMMVVNKNYNNIVTSGLVLNVDASFVASYPVSGTSWYDISGSGFTGTLVNGPTFNTGGWIQFDGTNDTTSFGTGNTFFPLPSFTIDLWFQSKGIIPTTGTVPGLFGFTYGIRAYFDLTNRIVFSVSSGSSLQNLTYTHSTNFRDDGSWNNIVFQATPTNSYIYLNGELKTSRSLTWLGDTIWPTNTWNLGRDNNNSNQFFTGSIASYKMYNRALSMSEILQNYYGGSIVTSGLTFAVDAGNLVSFQNGSGSTFSLVGSYTGTLQNGVSYTTGGGGSWVFDGIDDRISFGTGSNFDYTNFTAGIWAKSPTNMSGGTGFPIHVTNLVGKGNWNSNNSWRIGYKSSGTNPATFITFGYGITWSAGPSLSVNSFDLSVWNYFVGVATPTQQLLYLNGTLVSTVNLTKISVVNADDFQIGRSSYTDRFFTGNVGHSHIYDRALSASEVAQNYNAYRNRFGL